MKFVGIEKKEQGKFITRYDVQYETVDGIVKNYEMISRNGFRTEVFRRLGLIGSSEDWERLVRGVIQEFEENNREGRQINLLKPLLYRIFICILHKMRYNPLILHKKIAFFIRV